jgi:hypothetical protein
VKWKIASPYITGICTFIKRKRKNKLKLGLKIRDLLAYLRLESRMPLIMNFAK